MRRPKLLLCNCLIFAIALSLCSAHAQNNCKEIKATIEVFQAGQKSEKASVSIDFKGQSQFSFAVFLFGLKRVKRKEIEGNQIKDLDQGKYLLVFTSRRDEDDFCIKQTEFTIK